MQHGDSGAAVHVRIFAVPDHLPSAEKRGLDPADFGGGQRDNNTTNFPGAVRYCERSARENLPVIACRILNVIMISFVLAAALFTPPARAASSAVIYSFRGGADGGYPVTDLIKLGGTLYGTTSGFNTNYGTVFSITQAGVEKVVYSFKNGGDGAVPQGALINVNGTLYGTTANGGVGDGSVGCGTVFSLTRGGVKTVLYAFKCGSDGAFPSDGLVNVGAPLYGTTLKGGGSTNCTFGCGTVFSVTLSGIEKVVYAFQGGTDGLLPHGPLLNAGAALYGLASGGGSSNCPGGCGMVFSVTKAGVENVVHAFQGGVADGNYPGGGLIAVGGTFYGTTTGGGAYANYPRAGEGTVFSVTPAGVEKVLHSFGGFPGGNTPEASLIYVGGKFYGTTSTGGYPAGAKGKGTVFSMTPSGAVNVLFYFSGTHGGGNQPSASLINVGGALYGTTAYGGVHNLGTVFKITP
jgi:uncharacterized repeat protein (TIGR03803 family)